ncbi:lysozyme-like [Ctenocephalides felis]|uniref:lysozyme-like n=1 Tax=Ctenocephalides felis TaxID=7515 RepID=UPI000E6E52A4|nr:lysozyme-like [Ctenocephalides felis]
MKLLILFAIALAATCAEARILTRCQIAQELSKQGFPRDLLDHWVCLVEAESSGNTAAVGPPNNDGSRDYGLFQINNKYWCQNGAPGKDCNVSCEDLLTDDISRASTCAKLIYNRHGFSAWYGWQAKCQTSRPDISGCF